MSDDQVSSDEAAAVFRRAAELDQRQLTGDRTTLDLAALEQAGVEAGLSPQAIRQALAEVRAGTLEPLARNDAVVTRTLSGSNLGREVDRFMHKQRFRIARQLGDRTVWEPDRSFAAAAAKMIDFNRRIVLREISQLTTCVVPVPGADMSHVRFELDLGRVRWAWRSLPMAAGGLGLGAAVTLALAGIEPGAIAAGGAGIVLASGAYAGARAGYRGSLRRSVNAIERFLDRLEHGR